ncbi:MAG: hypothetical protein WC806_05615 [Candidatus Gracilibacteria bacterium]|jgi:hypothetical protein
MQIEITTKKGIVDRVLAKLSIVLFGVFLTSMIFAILIKLLGVYGIYLGILICGTLIFCGFYYIQKGTRLRLMAISMLSTIILITIVFLTALSFIKDSLNGL